MSALPLLTALALARACAPAVAPQTLLSVATAESGLDPLTIGINSQPHRALHPATAAEAVATAWLLTRRGVNFDIGLAQINSRNLSRLGLSLENAVDPCKNLAGEAAVLSQNYLAAQRRTDAPQLALRAALSTYNTGDAERGVRNGYVARVYQAAARVVPALQVADAADPTSSPAAEPVLLRAEPAPESQPSRPPLDVFAREPAPTLVWSALPAPPKADPRPRPLTHLQGEPS